MKSISADQRVDEVAEAGLEQAPGVDRPDEDQPVAAGEQRGEREQGEQAGLPQHGAHAFEAAGEAQRGQHQREQQRRPQHAVGDDLEGRHAAEGAEVERRQTPGHEGGERGEHALARGAGVGFGVGGRGCRGAGAGLGGGQVGIRGANGRRGEA